MFLLSQPVLLDIGLEIEPLVGTVDDDSDDTSDDDAREDNSEFAEIEPIDANISQRESFEETVVGRVYYRGVDIREENSGILDTDDRGDEQGLVHDPAEFLAALVDFGLGAELVISCQSTESLSSSEENVGCRGFGHGEEPRESDRQVEDVRSFCS